MSEGQDKHSELEEKLENYESSSISSLSEGEVITNSNSNGKYIIARKLTSLRWRPPYNLYEVVVPKRESSIDTISENNLENIREDESDQNYNKSCDLETKLFWLWEANTDETKNLLNREIEILKNIDDSRFPKIIEYFLLDKTLYLVTEKLPERTLADAITNGEINFLDFLTIIAQITHALSNLHEKGFVHLGVRPECILIDKPIKVVDFRWTMKIGEKNQHPFFHPGFSPHELTKKDEIIDHRADIYSVGALIHYFLEKKQLPETGFYLSDFNYSVSGIPQLLNKCLCSKDLRFSDMKSVHKEILKLKRRHTPLVTYEVMGATDIGLEPTRTTNQDAFAFIKINLKSEENSVESLFACIADGMGGMEAGELASDVAINEVISGFTSSISKLNQMSEEEQFNTLKQLIINANERVFSALDNRGVKGGTTLLCCLLVEDKLVAAHVGDCRLYLLRGDDLKLLTQDHSLAYYMASQEGNIDLNEIRKNPDRSKLIRSLGSHLQLRENLIDSLEVNTGKLSLELEHGDILILCSDGLWEPVSEEDMISIIKECNYDIQASIPKLIRCALERGAPDNVTLILVKIKNLNLTLEAFKK